MDTVEQTIYKVKVLAGEHPKKLSSYLKDLYTDIIIRLEELKDLKGGLTSESQKGYRAT